MWMKLGAVLVREGVITPVQLDEALAAQKAQGGRLGTILVDRKALSVETLGLWLGRISGFPCATREMLQAAPQELLELIPGELAARLECLPFRRDGQSLHVAVVNPYTSAVADALATRTKQPVLLYVVPDGLFYRFLELRYGITRKPAPPPPPVRGRSDAPRARPAPTPPRPQPAPPMPFPVVEAPPWRPTLAATPFPVVEAPPLREPTPAQPFPVVKAPPLVHGPFARGRPGRPAMLPAPEPPTPIGDPLLFIGEDAPTQPNPWLREDSPRPGSPRLISAPPALTVAQTATALAAARTRDAVVDAVLRYAGGVLDVALLLIVRENVATGWSGRGAGIDEDHVLLVALPLGSPSLFQEAYEKRRAVGGTVVDNATHRRLYKALRRSSPASAVVVPILLGGRVVNLLYGDRASAVDALATADSLSEVARQASAAYARILGEQRQRA